MAEASSGIDVRDERARALRVAREDLDVSGNARRPCSHRRCEGSHSANRLIETLEGAHGMIARIGMRHLASKRGGGSRSSPQPRLADEEIRDDARDRHEADDDEPGERSGGRAAAQDEQHAHDEPEDPLCDEEVGHARFLRIARRRIPIPRSRARRRRKPQTSGLGAGLRRGTGAEPSVRAPSRGRRDTSGGENLGRRARESPHFRSNDHRSSYVGRYDMNEPAPTPSSSRNLRPLSPAEWVVAAVAILIVVGWIVAWTSTRFYLNNWFAPLSFFGAIGVLALFVAAIR